MAKELNRIGGWLAFLIYFVLVIRSLLFGIMAYQDIFKMEGLSNNAILLCLIITVSVMLPLFAAYKLIKERVPESVQYAILALWISGPLSVLLYRAILFANAFEGREIIIDLQIIGFFVRPFLIEVVFALIWTQYLKRSKRVQNIYYNASNTSLVQDL